MPKVHSDTFFGRVVKEYSNDFQTDGSVLFCKMCDIEVAAKQMSQVKQHLGTTKHLLSVGRKSENSDGKTQSLLTTIQHSTGKHRDTNVFNMDLTRCFVKANIPLYKLRDPAMIDFIEKHTKYAAPSETVLRTKCVPKIHEEFSEKMKHMAAGKYIWVSLDETTDIEQRYVVNFVFGILGVEEERSHCYLFSSKVLDKVNNITIAKFFDETVCELGKLSCIHKLCILSQHFSKFNIHAIHRHWKRSNSALFDGWCTIYDLRHECIKDTLHKDGPLYMRCTCNSPCV